jgi:hypothetical protein|tara:strand:+ start:327 stop:533 length:207 start_codon:yes stop_codon:yes gene_type:complete
MGGLIKMKMNFTFEQPRHATFAPIDAAKQPMASRKYNKYRENQLAARRGMSLPPWWGLWYEKLPTASG